MNRKALLLTIQHIAIGHGWDADLYRTVSQDISNNTYINTSTQGTPNAIVLWRERGRPSVVHLGMLWEVEKWNKEMIAEHIRIAESSVACNAGYRGCSGHIQPALTTELISFR